MKITTEIEVVAGRYQAQVSTSGFTATEEEKLAEFGEPLVQIGGDFTGSATRPGADDPVAVEFSLPPFQRRIRSDFPVRRVFDSADDEDADVQAKVWADTIVNRLTTAKTELVAQTTAFIGETRTTV